MSVRFARADSALAAVFPLDLSGEVVALRASIDASRLSSGILSVAGVSYGYDRAVKANTKWERLMDGRTFHMTDLHARRGDFEDIDDDEVHRIMLGIVSIVQAYATHSVAVSCDVNLISEKLPKIANVEKGADTLLERAFRTPYGLMIHLCMFAMGRFANNYSKGKTRQISYILECGDEGQPGFKSYIDSVLGDQRLGGLIDLYSLSRLTTTPKEEMEGIFHSADFVAWEWSHQVERQNSKRPMRKSLSAATDQTESVSDYFGITMSDRRKNFFRHYDATHANRWARFLRETSEAKNDAEIQEAVNQWKKTR